MPVTIDVTIPAVPVDRRENAIFFSGENIVPMALGGEVPRYLVTALSGTIEKDSISFSLNFGDFPTRYSSRISTLPDKVSPLKTFPLRGWILIIFMTSLGLVLKKIPNIPPEFTASFYSGLGPMLILAACRFVRNGIK